MWEERDETTLAFNLHYARMAAMEGGKGRLITARIDHLLLFHVFKKQGFTTQLGCGAEKFSRAEIGESRSPH